MMLCGMALQKLLVSNKLLNGGGLRKQVNLKFEFQGLTIWTSSVIQHGTRK